ncbi:MAG TPA: hypothetical protein PLI09_01605 [Candidatus Hydrogenedentes bacterium]|nr:hypothetical protein [Candidatus Hydrogenedentota bacterium]
MTRLILEELSKNAADTLGRATEEGNSVLLQVDGKDIAVVVSLDEYRQFREWEDRRDLEAIQQSKEEPGEYMSWEELKAECGL